jgi:hypothetical protein
VSAAVTDGTGRAKAAQALPVSPVPDNVIVRVA